MSMVLYRKYRPSSFKEVEGQEHIVATIKNAIRREIVSHAYLFSGPRGTGKTTVARILAKALNCENPAAGEPCNQCSNCLGINQGKFLDLVEIDAATHTQVDKIRDLIEKINFSPTSGKYKVYIIDEVHMLSKGAFNALLKTLEEPPKHVVFILATTEVHKIPATIISRCQRFDFRRLKVPEIKKRLAEIAEKEGVKVEKGVLDFIAINSNGGLRDSESLLGQILFLEEDNVVTLKEVQEILGVADMTAAVKMTELIFDKEYGRAIDYANQITEEGYDLEQFAKSVIEYLRKIVLIKISPRIKEGFASEMTEEQIAGLENISKKISMVRLFGIIRVFIKSKEEIKSSILPQLPLELAVAEINIADKELLTNKATEDYNSKIARPIKKITDKVSQSVKQSGDFIKKSIGLETEKDKNGKTVAENGEKEKPANESVPEGLEIAGGNSLTLDFVKSEWSDILEEIKPYNHSLTAFLKTCQPVNIQGNKIVISCQYSFYKDKLHKNANRSIIEKAAGAVLKSSILVEFITNVEAQRLGYKLEELKIENEKKENNLVSEALNMFGGEVV